jgi:hypothetical protein
MKYPTASVDVPIGNCELAVAAINGEISEAIEFMGKVALRSDRNWLLANFTDDITALCQGLVLLRPVDAGLLIGMVEPCLLRAGAPMILVSADRTRAFEMTAGGGLLDRPVPRPAKVKEGVERAWTELVRRMRAVTTDDGAFRHESWELHLMPTTAIAH